MAEGVQFTEDEMKTVTDIRQAYVNIQGAFGQISINRIKLEQQLQELDKAEGDVQKEFSDNQSTEKEFLDSINKKYGDGNLDVNTGVFTPKTDTTKK